MSCSSSSSCAVVQVTRPAPAFKCEALVPGGDFETLSLESFKGKWVVLFFYPLDFTFVCPTEIVAFNDRSDEFRALNCEVLGASIDSKFSHHAWASQDRKTGGIGPMDKLKIALLADNSHQLSKQYGAYLEDAGHSDRSLLIIDDKGIVQHITRNAPPVGRSVDETLRTLQAFQFTAKHGEVCPAGWRPGSKSMKATPQESKAYFGAQ